MPGGGGHLHAGRGPDGTSADAEGKTWIDPAQLYGPDTATGSPAGAGASLSGAAGNLAVGISVSPGRPPG